jgi:prepilin-type N-terminal cleavage/methylation domain-containing protein
MYNVVGMSKNKLGFTLVELLVTMGLMAVLSAGVIAAIGPGSKQYARDTQRRADINTIASALEMYRTDNGKYPGAAELTAELVPDYLREIPIDPKPPAVYDYVPAPANCTVNPLGTRCIRFRLCGNLEKTGGTYCVRNP